MMLEATSVRSAQRNFTMKMLSNMIIFSALSLFSLLSNTASEMNSRQAVLEDAYSTSMDMMANRGYSTAWYTIQTPDGYLLEIHRLPARRGSDVFNIGLNQKYPVLLVHGILCSSAEFTNNFPGQSLAYQLADKEYDVWMINFRGNAYSRRNVNYSPNEFAFWDFSWQHMAEYDLRYVIDFILGTTKRDQLYIVGHSMGTTVPFAFLSTYPKYNEKVRALFALSPIIYLRFARGLVNILAALEPVFRTLLSIGLGELLPQSALMQVVANSICNGPQAVTCETSINLVLGDQPGCLNRTRFPVYLSHFPAGTSILTLVHFFQILKTQVFAKFDLGTQQNLQYYGKTTPPIYDMRNITTYVNLYYIDGDYLSNGNEANIIYQELTGSAGRNLIRLVKPLCGHMWLVWGTDIGSAGNLDIIRKMEQDSYSKIYPPRRSSG